MGLRLRLKPDVDVSSFPRDDQVILQAMKSYGVIVADNGSPWYISGVPDERWDNDVLQQLGSLHGSDFEAVDESALMVDGNSGQAAGAAPAPPPPAKARKNTTPSASAAETPNTSPTATASASEPAPPTTSEPVTTMSAPSSTEIAAREPDVTVRVRDNTSHGAWPWLVPAFVVVSGCAAAGYRLRRRLRPEAAESVVDHDDVAGPARLEHGLAITRAPDRDRELVAGEHG
jgi:hypothetical protein